METTELSATRLLHSYPEKFAEFKKRQDAAKLRVDLSSINLSGKCFYRQNFNGVIFTDARLQSIKFWECDLRNTIFVRADLRGTSFLSSSLTGSDLRHAIVNGMTHFVGATLTDAKVSSDVKERIVASFHEQMSALGVNNDLPNV
jgi:uncharacterized protein YjbI with pentapeptide repeats